MTKSNNIIRDLRIAAGYTQKTLAQALHITDKAVSKWERGLSMPDMALLPKLSTLLDADMELLLLSDKQHHCLEWAGLLDFRESALDLGQIMYDKPAVYCMLSHFLLVGIREIYILGDAEKLASLKDETYAKLGFCLSINPSELPKKDYMIMKQPYFLFGSDLTRHFQMAMTAGHVIQLTTSWNACPLIFCPAKYMDLRGTEYTLHSNQILSKTLGRGMVCFQLEDQEQLLDAANFVRMYQKTTGLPLGCLEEIAVRKGYISPQQAIGLARYAQYTEMLRMLLNADRLP